MSDNESESVNSLEEQIAQSELEILEAKTRLARIRADRIRKSGSKKSNGSLSSSGKGSAKASASASGSKTGSTSKSASRSNSASLSGSSPANSSSRSNSHLASEQAKTSAKASVSRATPPVSTEAPEEENEAPDWTDAPTAPVLTAQNAVPPLEPAKSMPVLSEKAKMLLGVQSADADDLMASSNQLGANGRVASAPLMNAPDGKNKKESEKERKESEKKEKEAKEKEEKERAEREKREKKGDGRKDPKEDKKEKERAERERQNTLRQRGHLTDGMEVVFASLLRTPLKDFKKILKEIKKGDAASPLVASDAKTGGSLIHFAARGHHFEHLWAILDKDETLIARVTHDLETPLHWLCMAATDVPEDRAAQLKTTLKQLLPSLKEKQDVFGRTPLHVAVSLNLVNIVKALLVDGTNSSGTVRHCSEAKTTDSTLTPTSQVRSR